MSLVFFLYRFDHVAGHGVDDSRGGRTVDRGIQLPHRFVPGVAFFAGVNQPLDFGAVGGRAVFFLQPGQTLREGLLAVQPLIGQKGMTRGRPLDVFRRLFRTDLHHPPVRHQDRELLALFLTRRIAAVNLCRKVRRPH